MTGTFGGATTATMPLPRVHLLRILAHVTKALANDPVSDGEPPYGAVLRSIA